MIDNRAILVLAVDTVEKIEAAMGITTIDQEQLLPIVEKALNEAWRKGYEQGLRQQASEKEAKRDQQPD